MTAPERQPIFANFEYDWRRDHDLIEPHLLQLALDALDHMDGHILTFTRGPNLDTKIWANPLLAIECESVFFNSLQPEKNLRTVLEQWLSEIEDGKKMLFLEKESFSLEGVSL